VLFHVIVSFGDDEKKEVIFKDIIEPDLKKLFIKPYKTGNNLFVKSKIRPTKSISYVKVIATEYSHKESVDLEIKKAESSGDELKTVFTFMYSMDDSCVEGFGKDVTPNYISTPPGQGTIISRIFNNQYFFRIGTGAALGIFAVSVAYIFGPS